MRANEFIKEWKIVDRIRLSKELHAAVKLFLKIKSKYSDAHDAVIDAAKMSGIGPRVLQDYLNDYHLMETVLMEGYIAFKLNNKSRNKLAKIFPPKYPDFIGDHITYKFGVKFDTPLPSVPKSVTVIGYADDGEGLEALVVEINGRIQRPDGKIYHITWSLDRDKGRKPVHSNNLVTNGFEKINPIPIDVKPEISK